MVYWDEEEICVFIVVPFNGLWLVVIDFFGVLRKLKVNLLCFQNLMYVQTLPPTFCVYLLTTCRSKPKDDIIFSQYAYRKMQFNSRFKVNIVAGLRNIQLC